MPVRPIGAGPGVEINPNADRPSLIGSIWRRREPESDSWDEVEICGVFDGGEMGGGLSLCVRPTVFGEPVLTADAESLAAAYVRADADDGATDRLRGTLNRLEALAG